MTTVRHRVRIRFCKAGDLRLLSHRDLVRLWERIFRRAEIPLAQSQGFHPKPKMNFPLALALGIAGHDELVEIELAEPLSGREVAARLQPLLPPGLELVSAAALPAGSPKARVASVTLELPLDEEPPRGELARRIEWLLAQTSHCSDRGAERGTVDVRPYLEALELGEGVLRFTLRVTAQGTARPGEILAALGFDDVARESFRLVRTAVRLEGEPPAAAPAAHDDVRLDRALGREP